MNAGEVIKFLRIKKKLKQDELGEILGVKKSAIQKYESGAVQNLKIETIRKLCDYFDMPTWVFIMPEYIKDINEIENSFVARNFKLNITGRKKLIEYRDDLLQIPKYREDIK